jgi:hypothetical protein
MQHLELLMVGSFRVGLLLWILVLADKNQPDQS